MEVFCEIDLAPLIAQGRKSRRALQEAFGEMVDLAYWTFQKLIDLTPKSGHSREGSRVADSWELKFQRYVFFRELAWSVLSDHEVVGYLEYGTRDHWVFPRIAKALHWVDPDTGEDVFSMGHIVSGIRPVGMIRRTEAGLEAELRKLQATTETRVEN